MTEFLTSHDNSAMFHCKITSVALVTLEKFEYNPMSKTIRVHYAQITEAKSSLFQHTVCCVYLYTRHLSRFEIGVLAPKSTVLEGYWELDETTRTRTPGKHLLDGL